MKNVQVDPQSIKIHSDQADYYKFRTPYIPKLFCAICSEIGVTDNSTLLDLGCGRGEVAGILANFAKKVYAIDGSKEMIELAERKDNIEYQVVDLNSDNPIIANKVDHIFFGRSIHWFPSETLIRISSDFLSNGGRIVVCSTQWSPIGDWGKFYFGIKNQFAPQPQSKRDFTGKSNLGGAGFLPMRRLSVDAILRPNINFMIGHAFSTTYRESLERLESLSSEFQSRMKAGLKIFEEKNEIAMKVTTWAIIYGKST